ncbi:period circadian protein-like [Mercenaria mercenaria]|uniref:period circadian protein-like n=1 Tax=Mercenaria mercenaria TaxID=6596 RepID=UPI001E1DB774|nr:period circadian protein-like [Mercenaria mercenaria]
MFRLIVLSVVCAVTFANPANRERRQAATNCLDAFKNVPNPCVNNVQSQVYFPHPTDNTKFIQCDRYGRMYIIQCPENLVYSSTTSTCRQQATSVVTQGTTMAPMPGTQPGTQPAVANPNNPCTPDALAAGNIYFAVKGDDTKFIECDMLGHANVLPCSSGLVWNEGRLSCVYKFVGSGGSGTGTGGISTGGTGTGTVTGTGTGTGSGNLDNPCTPETIAANKLFFPHPDSTKFIQCDLWGDVFVVSCPAGLVWNQYSETCASAFVNVSGNGK